MFTVLLILIYLACQGVTDLIFISVNECYPCEMLFSYDFHFIIVSLAPGAPAFLDHTHIIPSQSHGPMIEVSWAAPSEPNGVVRNYTVFYNHSEDPQDIHTETFGADVLSYTVDVLGGLTYWFNVRAETIKPGISATLSVEIPEYSKLDSGHYFLEYFK